MIFITLTYAVVMTLFGIALYGISESKSWTALFPLVFSIPTFILLGIAIVKPRLKMHMMHVIVLIALIGVLGGFGRGVTMIGEKDAFLQTLGTLGIGLFSAVFMFFAVRSFIEARRKPKVEAATPAEEPSDA